jgi:hypothetical protein
VDLRKCSLPLETDLEGPPVTGAFSITNLEGEEEGEGDEEESSGGFEEIMGMEGAASSPTTPETAPDPTQQHQEDSDGLETEFIKRPPPGIENWAQKERNSLKDRDTGISGIKRVGNSSPFLAFTSLQLSWDTYQFFLLNTKHDLNQFRRKYLSNKIHSRTSQDK